MSNFSGMSGHTPGSQQPYLLHQNKHESVDVLKSTRSYLAKTQEEVWREFKDHFSNPNRERGKMINHHDFLDASFVHKNKD